MIRYLLNTNIRIALIRHNRSVRDRLVACAPGTAAFSVITLPELEFGIQESAQPDRNRIALAAFTAQLRVLPFAGQADFHYGDIRTALQRAGTSIGPLDTLIAAHARSINAISVTRNESKFRRMGRLETENWLGDC